jgi:formiminotetrahydrofolate cyclodeaminase
MGAALAAMVGNLTFGKKGYEAHYEALASMAAEAQRVKGELMAAVDEDTDAFDAVLAASRLPKATAEQRAARDAAMLDAGKMAAAVPMATARACLEAMKCCAVAVDRGNRNSITDGAAGALIAKAGLDAALLNVRINLASLGDADFAARLRAESAALAASAEVLAASIKASADAAIGG